MTSTRNPAIRLSLSLPPDLELDIQVSGENAATAATVASALLQTAVEICGPQARNPMIPHSAPLPQLRDPGHVVDKTHPEEETTRTGSGVGDLPADFDANFSKIASEDQWSLAIRPAMTPHWQTLQSWETRPDMAEVYLALLSFGGFEDGPEDAGTFRGFTYMGKSYSAWVDWRLSAPDYEAA
jgi:hypothetical protein